MSRSRASQLAALFLAVGLLLLLVAVAATADAPASTEAAKCTIQSSRFWADTGPASRWAPGGVGRVWDQNYILWTIASDYGGMTAAQRAQAVSEQRLVPWTMGESSCKPSDIHLGMYHHNYVIYRATESPYLPTADNVIVTVDRHTARYNHDTTAHLAYYWWYRLTTFLRMEVPAESLPPQMEKKAAPLASASYQPTFSAGNEACGVVGGCGCGVGPNPNPNPPTD